MQEKQRPHYDLDEIKRLVSGDLHKSQQHWDTPGQWLDIYRPCLAGQRMYIKFTVRATGDVLLMSFCRDGEVH